MYKTPIIFILFLTISCKKREPTNQNTAVTPYIQFNPDAVNYVQLPLNNYFIYKDSATAELDSVVVTQNDVKKMYSPSYFDGGGFGVTVPAVYYQVFTLVLTKYNVTPGEKWFYAIATNVGLQSSLSIPDSVFLNLLEKDPITNSDRVTVFNYPIIPESSLVDMVDTIKSLNVEGKTYLNIAMFMYANTPNSTDLFWEKSTYYWAKGIGIIKRKLETHDSVKTYFLVRNG